jgi:glycosyltransferase involved in cell wall biosynthesis
LGREYKRTSLAARIALDRVSSRLRAFDAAAAGRVDHFIANSIFVANRIKRYYRRDADVVYPPVAVGAFHANADRDRFHLVVSELVPYKRIDLAIDAYSRLSVPLVVIGDGPERAKLERRASANIRFLGRQPFDVLRDHMQTAEAFVFPGIEDFGITPVEAQASGCPVIAFRAGGALETVMEGETGVFFDDQSPESLIDAVERLQQSSFSTQACRRNAERFSEERFRHAYSDCLERLVGRRLFSNETVTQARRA